MCSLDFQRESLIAIWDEALPLFKENNSETGFFPDLNLNKEKYERLDQADTLLTFTARKDNNLVGYCTHFLSLHQHYRDVFWATQDAFYMIPECRGIPSVRFLKWADDALKNFGVQFVARQVTPLKNYARTLERLKYEPVETTFVRGLF